MIRLPCGTYFNQYEKEQAYIHTKAQWISFCLFIIFIFLLPFLIPIHLLSFFIITLITLISVIGLQITTGLSGQINLGQSAFMGAGAYICAAMLIHFNTPFWINIICGGLAGALFGILFGIPAIRIKGFYLALVTIAAQIIFPMLIIQIPDSIFGGPSGLNLERPRIFGITIDGDTSFYYLTIIVACIMVYCAFNLARSNIGRVFFSIRDNDTVVELIGINIKYYKIIAFAIGAFYAGVAGSLWAYYLQFITASQFTLHNSIWFIGMIIIGGLGSILGAIIGTFFLKILQEFLTFLGPVMADLFPNLGGTEIWFGVTNVILGVIILLFLILEPRGFVHRWNVIKFGWRIWPFPY